MAELCDIPKELWDKILFTGVIKPVPCSIRSFLSYIYVNPDRPNSSYIWILPDGRLVQSDWVFRAKPGVCLPPSLVYVGQGYFHHQQQRKT
jgi:hypothetical protein